MANLMACCPARRAARIAADFAWHVLQVQMTYIHTWYGQSAYSKARDTSKGQKIANQDH